jgi:PKD repeat protein
MKFWTILSITALLVLLALPGAVSAGDNVVVSGSILPAAPVAAFSATPLVGVAPLSVEFTDMSTGTVDTWKWEYNDGSGWTEFSTDQNPEKEFTTARPYDVRLTVTNAGGSDDETKTHYIATANVREPLITVQSGTVSGDLYVSSPHTYATGVTEVTETFTLPAAAVGNIQWAKLYVNTYSGSAANTYALTSTVKLDGTTLGVETMDIASETNGHSYPLNDHVNKVYSDYEAQYDVTAMISSASPEVNVKSEAITGKSFDGRIKGVTLVVAYNDGDSDHVKYWVNHGGDWSSPAGGSTTFDTTGITSGWTSAESKIRYHSSSDATTYTFNGVSKSSSTPPDTGGALNTWDVSSDLTAGLSSMLEYSKTSGSYKTNLATLVVRYIAPGADFSATPLTGDAPLEVVFTDASTGATSWAWDFDNDGTTDSTDQNPAHTYNTAGIYSVELTVTGPLGSDSMTKTNYITVKEPAPVVDFEASTTTPVVGQAVTFTGSNTGGAVDTWTWDFGDGSGSGQTAPHTYNTAGTYTVSLTATGPDYTDTETKANYITVGAATIEVTVGPASIDFGTMSAGTDETGNTDVNVDVTGGTAWSVTASASNGGYMGTGTANLANPFQLSKDGTNFQAMTTDFENFLTGTAGNDGTGTGSVKQAIDASDAAGDYAITITFTGGFS